MENSSSNHLFYESFNGKSVDSLEVSIEVTAPSTTDSGQVATIPGPSTVKTNYSAESHVAELQLRRLEKLADISRAASGLSNGVPTGKSQHSVQSQQAAELQTRRLEKLSRNTAASDLSDAKSSPHSEEGSVADTPTRRFDNVARSNRPDETSLSAGNASFVDESGSFSSVQPGTAIQAIYTRPEAAPQLPITSPSPWLTTAQIVNEDEERKRYMDETRRSIEAQAVQASVVDVRKRQLGIGLLFLLAVGAVVGGTTTLAASSQKKPPIVTVSAMEWVAFANNNTLSNQTLYYPPRGAEPPEELAIEWLVEEKHLIVPEEKAKQKFALVTLSFALGYPEWRDAIVADCELKGVGCGLHGEVDYMYARQQNMTGTIPNDLALLSKLTHLTLSGNKLDGTIPWDPMMIEMTDLEFIDLDYCNFSGPMPSPRNGTWGKLEKFWAAENLLTGTLSAGFSYWTNLQHIYAPENLLYGTLPTELAKLDQLTWFSMYDNGFTGSIPTEFGQWTDLRFFEISRNKFQSSFPVEIAKWSNLIEFQPQRNQFSGSLPSGVGRWTNLKVLEVDYNRLTGSLPTEIGQWTLLTHLRVDNNEFHGSLPTEIGLWTDIEHIYVDGNDFTGTIPMEVLNWKDVADGYFHRTSLEGTAPFCLQDVHSLFTLYADCCDITCPCCSNCFYDENGANSNCTILD